VTEPPTGCRLYAVVEAGEAVSERLAAALTAASLTAVLIAPVAGQRLQAATVKPLLDQVRQAGLTALILDDPQLARTVGADGVHLSAQDDPQAAYATAREAVGAGGVVGVEAGISRHAAMLLAEAGADYVGFGAPPHLTDRDKARVRREDLIAWWAPIFEVPCVAFDVETPEEAAQLADAGADFIGVALPDALGMEAARERIQSVAKAIRTSTQSS
jgi:thiamine-phosphate pyrophosphorylase